MQTCLANELAVAGETNRPMLGKRRESLLGMFLKSENFRVDIGETNVTIDIAIVLFKYSRTLKPLVSRNYIVLDFINLEGSSKF